MGIIELQHGCPEGGKVVTGCWGPIGDYYTVFGTELRFLTLHIMAAGILGIALFALLLFARKKISLPVYLMAGISICAAILLFFLFAYLFPERVLY